MTSGAVYQKRKRISQLAPLQTFPVWIREGRIVFFGLISPSREYNFQVPGVPKPARLPPHQLMMINSEGSNVVQCCVYPALCPLCPGDILCHVMIGNSSHTTSQRIMWFLMADSLMTSVTYLVLMQSSTCENMFSFCPSYIRIFIYLPFPPGRHVSFHNTSHTSVTDTKFRDT